MKFITIPYPEDEFEMAETSVTQQQYVKTMGTNPSQFKGSQNPIEQVSWNDAKEFIQKLNKSQKKFIYRLPTEKEFEFAMGKDPADSNLKDYAWFDENSKNKTHSVKKKMPNEYGLYDIRGNVWEWCEDLVYGSNRVIRGGSWRSSARALRSAFRADVSPGNRFGALGFRLVRTPITLGTLTLSPSSDLKSEAHEVAEARIREIVRDEIDKLRFEVVRIFE